MGRVTSSITYRTASTSPTGVMAAACQALHDALIASGMNLVVDPTKVSEYTTKWVTTTPGANEKQIASVPTVFTTYGVNYYEHPTMSFRLAVGYRFVATSGNNYFCPTLSVGRDFTGVDVLPSVSFTSTYVASWSTSQVSAGSFPMRVACADNYFWLYGETPLTATTLAAPATTFSTLPNPPSPLAVAVFSYGSEEVAIGSGSVALSGTVIQGPSFAVNEAILENQLNPYSVGRIVNPPVALPSGCLGSVDLPQIGASAGVRISKSAGYIGGQPFYPELAFAPLNAVTDGQTLTLDLDGAGDRDWVAAHGFISANRTGYSTDRNEIKARTSIPLLPWPEA